MRMCASGLLRPRRRTESTAPALWLPTDEEAKRLAQQLLRFRFGSGDDEDGEDGNDGEDCNDSEDGTDGREGNGSECHKGKGNGGCDNSDEARRSSVCSEDEPDDGRGAGAGTRGDPGAATERTIRLPVDSEGRIALLGAKKSDGGGGGAHVELTTRELRRIVLPHDDDGRPLLVVVETDDELDRYARLTGEPHRLDLLHALRTYEDAVVSGDLCSALRGALREADGATRLAGEGCANEEVRARVAELLCVLASLYVSPASGFRVIGGTPYADLHMLAVRVCSDQMTDAEAQRAARDTQQLMARLGSAYRALIPLVETGRIDTAEGRREVLGHCDTIALGALAILGPHVAVRARHGSGRLADPTSGAPLSSSPPPRAAAAAK